jgi:hypothetical protein
LASHVAGVKILVAIALVIAALVGGCWIWLDHWLGPHTIDLPPAISGEFSGDGSGRRPLNGERLTAISSWLVAHHSGWGAQVATAPGPTGIIELHHADGTTTALDIYHAPPSLPGWNGAIVLRHFTDPRHPDGGVQKFSAPDFEQLLRVIGH